MGLVVEVGSPWIRIGLLDVPILVFLTSKRVAIAYVPALMHSVRGAGPEHSAPLADPVTGGQSRS